MRARLRVGAAKLRRQRAAGELGERAGELDAGWAAADDREDEAAGALCFSLRRFGAFEGAQEAIADRNRVLDCLQAGGAGGPLVAAEIGMVVDPVARTSQSKTNSPAVERTTFRVGVDARARWP